MFQYFFASLDFALLAEYFGLMGGVFNGGLPDDDGMLLEWLQLGPAIAFAVLLLLLLLPLTTTVALANRDMIGDDVEGILKLLANSCLGGEHPK